MAPSRHHGRGGRRDGAKRRDVTAGGGPTFRTPKGRAPRGRARGARPRVAEEDAEPSSTRVKRSFRGRLVTPVEWWNIHPLQSYSALPVVGIYLALKK